MMNTSTTVLLLTFISTFFFFTISSAAPAGDSSELHSKLKKEAPFCNDCKARPSPFLVGKRRTNAVLDSLNMQLRKELELGSFPPAQTASYLEELPSRMLIKQFLANKPGEEEVVSSNRGDRQQNFQNEVPAKKNLELKSPFCEGCVARRLVFTGKRGGSGLFLLGSGGSFGRQDSSAEQEGTFFPYF